jgi:nucleoside diphosphate kinase
MAAWMKLAGRPFTLAIIKPDVAASRKVVSLIMHRIEQHGFDVIVSDRIERLPMHQVQAFYHCHHGRYFFDRLTRMMSSYVPRMRICRECAVANALAL